MATSLRNMSRISYPNLQKDQHPKALYVKLVMYEAYPSKVKSKLANQTLQWHMRRSSSRKSS